jgi:hypothetical protein
MAPPAIPAIATQLDITTPTKTLFVEVGIGLFPCPGPQINLVTRSASVIVIADKPTQSLLKVKQKMIRRKNSPAPSQYTPAAAGIRVVFV